MAVPFIFYNGRCFAIAYLSWNAAASDIPNFMIITYWESGWKKDFSTYSLFFKISPGLIRFILCIRIRLTNSYRTSVPRKIPAYMRPEKAGLTPQAIFEIKSGNIPSIAALISVTNAGIVR